MKKEDVSPTLPDTSSTSMLPQSMTSSEKPVPKLSQKAYNALFRILKKRASQHKANKIAADQALRVAPKISDEIM